MKSQATVASVAIAILANVCVSSSFETTAIGQRLAFGFNQNHVVPLMKRQKVMPMQQSVSLDSPSALKMADGPEEKDYVSPMRQRPRPEGGDMAYNNENILRQLRYYNDIRKVGGKDCVQDLYVRDPSTSGSDIRYWFVGKTARCTGTVSSELAIGRQFNLIEEHATRIRPIELGRSYGSLEFYAAPGDTEPLTSQNDPGIRLKKVPRSVDGAEKVALLEVGLNLEIVTNQGAGFYIIRTEDGIVPPHLIGQ